MSNLLSAVKGVLAGGIRRPEKLKESSVEIYVSTDIEADGPIPGPHSMLSFGSAAYQADKTLIATFAANLETLPGAAGDPNTMAWWGQNAAARDDCRTDLQPPHVAMKNYVEWLKALPGRPVFVAYPAGFDFLFVYWYLIRFAGESPFSHSALDVKTYAMGALKKGYLAIPPSGNMPRPLVLTTCRTFYASAGSWTMPSSRDRCSATCSRKTCARSKQNPARAAHFRTSNKTIHPLALRRVPLALPVPAPAEIAWFGSSHWRSQWHTEEQGNRRLS